MQVNKEIVPVIINGISRKAEVVKKQPQDSIRLKIRNSIYRFYELVEEIGDDKHHWLYAIKK